MLGRDFKDVFKYVTGCFFSICIGVGIFILFAVVYESTHGKSRIQVEDTTHDYVEVNTSDPKNVVINSYHGYQAKDEYLLDRWQTEDGVIAVTIYFEEADNTK